MDWHEAVWFWGVKDDEHTILTSNEKPLGFFIVLKGTGSHIGSVHYFDKCIFLPCDFEIYHTDDVLTGRVQVASGLVYNHIDYLFFVYFKKLVWH